LGGVTNGGRNAVVPSSVSGIFKTRAGCRKGWSKKRSWVLSIVLRENGREHIRGGGSLPF